MGGWVLSTPVNGVISPLPVFGPSFANVDLICDKSHGLSKHNKKIIPPKKPINGDNQCDFQLAAKKNVTLLETNSKNCN